MSEVVPEQPAEPAEPVQTPETESQEPDSGEKQPKPTETVEFWKQKAREQENRAKSNAEAARRLKEIEDRDLSDLQRAQRDAEEARNELTSLRRTSMVQQVALEKGIPASLAARLQGQTPEELAADADSLIALIGKRAPQPDPGQGNQVRTPTEEFDAEYAKYYPN